MVEVFADVCCPFTHVGLRRFVERRAEAGRAEIGLHVRAWPLEIVNGAPIDPDLVAEEVEELRAQVAPSLFAGFTVDAFPSTSLPAFVLASAAYRRSTQIGEAVSLELRSLLFERGLDISDPDVLDTVAHAYDLEPDAEDRAAPTRDHDEGVRRGVIGSPHFFVASGAFFCPALEIRRDEAGQLRIDADPAGFDEFLSACWEPPEA
jgi:predicted DsbA family dithiol-disulfide isomerase